MLAVLEQQHVFMELCSLLHHFNEWQWETLIRLRSFLLLLAGKPSKQTDMNRINLILALPAIKRPVCVMTVFFFPIL